MIGREAVVIAEDGSVIIVMQGDNKDAIQKLDDVKDHAKKVEKELNPKKSISFNVDVSEMEKGFQLANEKSREINRQILILEEKVRNFSGDRNSEEFQALQEVLTQKRNDLVLAHRGLEEAFEKTKEVSWKDYSSRDISQEISDAAISSLEHVNQLRRELEQAKQTLKDLEKGGKWFGDEEYDRAALNLQKLNEQVKAYKKELYTKGDENPFSLNNYAGKIQAAENEMARLSREGKGFGDAEYDKAFQKLELLRKELKEYKAELMKSAPAQDIAPQDPRLQELSEEAKNAVQRISELQQKLADLQEQNNKLGWALGARGERERLEAEIEGVNGKILETRSYLDSLAESGDLSQIAGGAGIAEQRISELSQELAALQEQQSRMGLALGGRAEYDALSAKIAEINRLLEVYHRELEAAPTGGLRDFANEAEIAREDIVELSRELASLKERQKELSGAGLGLGYQEFDQNAARIAEITRQLKDYQKQLQQGGAGGEDPINRTALAAKKMNAILQKSSGAYKSVNGAVKYLSQLAEALEGASLATGGAISKAFQMAGTAVQGFGTALSSALTAVSPYILVISVLTKAVQGLISAAGNRLKQFISAIGKGAEAIRNFAAAMVKGFSNGWKTVKKFGSSAGKIVSGFVKKLVETAKEMNVLTKVSDAVGKKLHRLAGMIKRVFIFSVITKGLREVRTQLSSYLSLNAEFVTATGRIKGALLTAFQPIYEAVLPALTVFIGLLTRAIATVTQFVAVLFGTSAKQAQENAKKLYEQANALKATGEAAEEAAGSLAGFDEINQIQTENKASGGGGSAADLDAIFDYDYDDTPFDSWGEAFSAFLDKLLDGIPQMEVAFKGFADKLNDFSKKLYDMFKFPGVLEKVEQLGRDLAAAFNKLVDWIDFGQLGRALGAGLNLALQFLTELIYGFDWMALGRKLADFINGLASEIDWYDFGRLLWAGFKIGLETLAGFILGLNMPLMAEAASHTIMGFFDEMKKTIDIIPWGDIGSQIASFLSNIKWYEVITSVLSAISAAVNALFDMVRSFIDDLQWNDIARQISAAINDSLGKIEWREAGQTLGDLFIHIFDFIRDVVSQIQWKQIGTDIGQFLMGINWPGLFKSVEQAIAAGIVAVVNFLRGLIDETAPKVKEIAAGIVTALKDFFAVDVQWDELAAVIGDGIQLALSFVSGLLDPDLFYEIGKAIGDFLVNLNWPEMVGGLAEVLANGINSAVAAVNGFLDSVQPNLKEIADGIAEKINNFFDEVDWAELGATISRGIEAALDFMIELMDQIDWDAIGASICKFLENIEWDTLLTKWGELLGKFITAKMKLIDLSGILDVGKNIVKGLWNGVWAEFEAGGGILGWLKRLFVDKLIEGVKDLFGIHSPSTVFAEIGRFLIEGLLQGISETWGGIVEFFGEKIGNLKDSLSESWENIKTTASEKWEDIKNSLGESWENIKASAQEKFNGIKEKIGEVWDTVKTEVPQKWEGIKTALGGKWDEIKTAASNKFTEIKDKVGNAWDTVKTEAPQKWEQIKTVLSGKWTEVKTSASEKFGEVKKSIIEKMDGTMTELKGKDWFSIGKGLVSKLLDGLKSIFSGLSRWASDVWNSITGAFSQQSARSSFSGSFGRTSSGEFYANNSRMASVQIPDNFTIPHLAQGAVIPANREFLAVLGDQKNGNNLEGPESLFRQIVREEAGGGNLLPVLEEILSAVRAGQVIMVDRRKLGQTIRNELNRVTRATGRDAILS